MSLSCDFMDYMDNELASIIGEAFPNNFSNDYSPPSTFTNIHITPSTTTLLCTQPPPPPQIRHEPPQKQRNLNNLSNFENTSSSFVLNFQNENSLEKSQLTMNNFKKPEVEAAISPTLRDRDLNIKEAFKDRPTGKKTGRTRVESYDHIGAERKRREQLSQLFVTLSAIVPGLKKMDKTSVLGDAITYLKQLQERVKTLEEQTATQTIESVVLVKKSELLTENETTSFPEIEARLCNKSILLNILCEKRKGLLVNILGEVEKMNMTVVNTSVVPFGSMVFHMTIIAEMEKEFKLSVKDVIMAIRSATE